MGIGGIGIWQLLIILLIVVLLFGTKRLRNIGQDMGNAVRGFRSAVKDGEEGGQEEETSERLSADSPQEDADFDAEKKQDERKP